MTLSEKAAYLKGLMEGLKLNEESDEGKMFAGIVDLLGDMAKNIANIEETTIAISDELDEIEDDLDAIDDFIAYLDDEAFEDDYDDEDYDELDEEDEDEFDFDDTTVYEVECKCGGIIDFDEETLESGSITCPNCGEVLEFTTEEDDLDD